MDGPEDDEKERQEAGREPRAEEPAADEPRRRRMFGVTGKAFMVTPVAKMSLGPLARVPLLGPALFDHNPMVYFTFLMVPLLWLMISRTRYGLTMRAAGERPDAADASPSSTAALSTTG